MQLFVKTLTGMIAVDVQSSDTIAAVKQSMYYMVYTPLISSDLASQASSWKTAALSMNTT